MRRPGRTAVDLGQLAPCRERQRRAPRPPRAPAWSAPPRRDRRRPPPAWPRAARPRPPHAPPPAAQRPPRRRAARPARAARRRSSASVPSRSASASRRAARRSSPLARPQYRSDARSCSPTRPASSRSIASRSVVAAAMAASSRARSPPTCSRSPAIRARSRRAAAICDDVSSIRAASTSPARAAARSAAEACRASGRSRAFSSASRSRARARLASTRASFCVARCRRRLYLPRPAASSMKPRRSAGRDSRISSTRPWLTIACSSRPRPASASASCTSSRRTARRFSRYWASASRRSRRITEISGRPLPKRPSSLSRTSSTSHSPDGWRRAEPPNSTSAATCVRSSLGGWLAIAHCRPSATFDLPEPFGPTMTAMPRSKCSSTGSAKLLKPRSFSVFRYMGRYRLRLASRCCERERARPPARSPSSSGPRRGRARRRRRRRSDSKCFAWAGPVSLTTTYCTDRP